MRSLQARIDGLEWDYKTTCDMLELRDSYIELLQARIDELEGINDERDR